MDLAARGVGEVADALNGDTAKASEMINRARSRLSELGVLAKDFVSAKELYQRRQNIERITTGSKSLDELLGGGGCGGGGGVLGGWGVGGGVLVGCCGGVLGLGRLLGFVACSVRGGVFL